MEYLILIGFLTLVLTTILGIGLYYSTTAEDRLRATQIQNYGTKVISSAESVYYSGEPSKATINPYLPEGVTGIGVYSEDVEAPSGEKEYYLNINISLPTGQNVLTFRSQVPLEENSSSRLSHSSGIKTVVLKAQGFPNYNVLLSEG